MSQTFSKVIEEHLFHFQPVEIGDKIVTSVIVPGTIDTPENRKAMPGADTSTWVTADEIADIIYFYSSEAANSLRQPVIKAFNS